MAIETQAFTARDLTSEVAVYSKTADAATAGHWQHIIIIGDGTGSGDDPDKDESDFDVRVTIDGAVVNGGAQTLTKETYASDTPIRVETPVQYVASGETAEIKVKSSNASDTAVKVKVLPVRLGVNVKQWLGTAPATPDTAGVPVVDVKAISGDSDAADNLESACDGTGYNVGNGAVVAASVTSKTGYKLAFDGLDSVSTTAPSGVASNFREMLVQVWRRFFVKATKNSDTGQLQTYADNGTDVLTTQSVTDDGTTETVGDAV